MNDIEIETVADANSAETMYTITQLMPWFAAALIVAMVVGVIIGAWAFRKGDKPLSLEKIIIVIAAAITVGAVFCATVGYLERFSSVVITAFSSIVFSWLLTKSSNKAEWRDQEQELAVRSYRHINYIETASKTASKMINQYIVGDEKGKLGEEEKLILSRAMDYIGYIQGGINTCKLDWVDLMSDEKKKDYLDEDPSAQSDAAGQLVTVVVNQEDA